MNTKTLMGLCVLAAVALAACDTTATATRTATAPATDFVRVSTQTDMAPIVDRRLAFQEDDFIFIRSNGTLDGEFGGVETTGNWEMRDGFFCRTLTAGPPRVLENRPTECQLFEIQGNTVRGTRERGEGPSFTYTIT